MAIPRIRLLGLLSTLLLAVGCGGGTPPTPPPTPAQESTSHKPESRVGLKVVSYKDLCSEIRGMQGKIVVVDAWATWCVPCMEGIPHLVDIHKQHAKDGVVCVTVSLDAADDKAKVLGFLEAKKADFPNYLLDERGQFWQNKWNLNGPPVIFVFDRENRLVRRFDNDDPDRQFTHKDVEKVVTELLRGEQTPK